MPRRQKQHADWRVEGAVAKLDGAPEVAEPAMQEAHLHLATILERITDAFIVLDSQGLIIYLNNKAALLLQHTQAEMVGKNVWDIFPEGIGTIFYQKFFEAVATQHTTCWDAYYEPLETWFELHAYPSPDNVSIYFNDITSRKRAEAEQEELARRKDRFISMASHELKNPITSIKGFSQILRKHLNGKQDELAKHCLDRIENQLDKLTRLIDDMLDLSKMETGELMLYREHFDLLALVTEVVEDFQQTAQAQQILSTSDMQHAVVYGDRNRIEQVLLNLLTNVIKYASDSARIVIKVTREEALARVSVQDFGPGITRSQQEKIFERFYQVNEGTGLGIGLYIAQEIIRLHNGEMGVESQEGEGSTFWFTLPLASD